MRYENPVLTGGPRFATQDTDVNGAAVRAGDMVSLCWTTANLDPDVFDRPLEVDLDRPANRHVAFAAGRHRCLGSNLARLELRTAIEEFHRRVGRYWITEGDEPRYNHQGVRAAEHLPLSFEPPTS
jgi:cytochrome P450